MAWKKEAVCSSNITIHEHSDHIVRQTIACVLIFWKCTCISKTECNKYWTTYMYSWYTLFRGDQGQFSDWNGQPRHAWIVTCRRSFELSEVCFLWVQDWIQVHLISFFGVFCNFKTNHIFTILQLKVKMMWSLVEFLSMRTFYDTCYTKNECRWQSALNIISQDIC